MLDRTVLNDERTCGDIAVKMTSGAFRFVTGHSVKAAYKISTPLATIGVRITILDILSQRGKTTVVLKEGGSHVCNRPDRNASALPGLGRRPLRQWYARPAAGRQHHPWRARVAGELLGFFAHTRPARCVNWALNRAVAGSNLPSYRFGG
jgi:hypothetical protein